MRNSIISFFLLSVIIGSVNYAQQRVEPKIWSRIQVDENYIPEPVQNVNYVPAIQVKKIYELDGSEAIVYPNYRPWPGSNTTQSELSIDIHPNNMDILFCSSNATNYPFSVIWGTGIYFTTNGGTSWTGYDNPPFGTNSGDPASIIGANGYFYEGFIKNDYGQGVARSTNNGVNWTSYTAGVTPGFYPDLLDKNHLMIDKKSGSPYENRLYSAWTRFDAGHVNNNKIEVVYSSNDGVNWSTPLNVSSGVNAGSHDQGVNIQTGNNGEVYAAWSVYDNWGSGTYGEDAIGFNKSTNGGQTWQTAARIYSANNFGIRGELKSTLIRVSSFPSMAVDRSGGSNNGNIYICWPQKGVAPAGTSPDIVLIRSTNNGTTWSAPVRVNDDPISNGKDQYYPWITVDQSTGHLYAVFYDSRGVHNDSAEVYMARSIDGGLTFENIKVSDAKFKPKPISGLAGGYQGDYIGIAGLNNTIYPFWADDRTGNYQAWITKVTFGPNLTHTPLPNTENLNGPYTVDVNINSQIPLVPNKLKVYWGRGTIGVIQDSITLTQVSGTLYRANIPGNGTAATYTYYIYAEDNTGGYSTLPAGAPGNYYTFQAMPDNTPPSITHTVLGNQYRELWDTTKVNAVITDNIGIESVWIECKLKWNGSIQNFQMSNQTGNLWNGSISIDTALITVGDTIYYRIVARDASAANNLGYHPSQTGFNSFSFIADTQFPLIIHTALKNQPKITWPPTVRANVTDNMSISLVKCEYSINNGTLNGSFNMDFVSGDQYAGVFNLDTTQFSVGDSITYRIAAEDGSTSHNISYHPAAGTHKFYIVNTRGSVLVANDDISFSDRFNSKKGPEGDNITLLGASAELFKNILSAHGYVVDSVEYAEMDTSLLDNYDIIILSSGPRVSDLIFDPQSKRTAIINYTNRGGKTLVEGGEVGYTYQWYSWGSEKDAIFRRTVLHDSSWLGDVQGSTLKKRLVNSTFWNSPNFIPDNITFTGDGYGPRDVVTSAPNVSGIFKYAGWNTFPDTAGIIAYSPINDTLNIRNMFFTFSVSNITDQNIAGKLIENAVDFLMGSGSGVPVELTAFTAENINGKVILKWSTATELNNSGFSIERKTENGIFENISFIYGRGTTTEAGSYSYTDENVNAGNYTYRLKQVDFDGTSSYSNEINITVEIPAVFALEQNYPNPFNPSTLIKYSIPKDGFVSLTVYNVLGQKVLTLVNQNLKAGRHEAIFNAGNLATGLYIYKLESAGFSSVKKMLMIK